MNTNQHLSDSGRLGSRLPSAVTAWIASMLLISGASAGTVELASPNPTSGGAYGAAWDATIGLPDLTGDGIGELLVSASWETVEMERRGRLLKLKNAGRKYVYDGATLEVLYTIVSPRLPTVVSWGTVHLAGDVNDDGVEDLMIFVGGTDGTLYFYSGKNGELLFDLESPDPARQAGGFGFAAGKLEDVDGDDHLDWVVGEGRWSTGGPGRIYVFSGVTREVIWQTPVARLGQMGFGCRALPDLNGDGAGDIAVSYPQENVRIDGQSIQGAGFVSVLSGVDGEELYRLTSPQPEAEDHLGEGIDCLGDVDGDGVPDLVVGSHWGGAGEEGRAWLFSGADGHWIRTLSSPIECGDGYFGWAIEPLPDRTGDGVKELWILGCEWTRGFVFDGATGEHLETIESPGGDSFWPASMTADNGETLKALVFADRQAKDSGRVYLAFERTFPTRVCLEPDGDGYRVSCRGETGQYVVEETVDFEEWTKVTTVRADRSSPVLTSPSPQTFYRLRRVE